MIILGVDPGSQITGYGILKVEGNRIRLLDAGPVRLKKIGEIPARLHALYEALKERIEAFKPDVLAVEKVFHGPNFNSTIRLGYVRGVILSLAGRYELDVHEYSPGEVKKSVTGYGKAEKSQVQEMVRILLSLQQVPKPHDVADALAIAICHAHHAPMLARQRFHGGV
ncbi:MAG: crossover junction endodeoxyribonuclease RuvC [Acidobacteriota bacterium]|nr:crossover junction endodeoxyribonuclease RuvC [Acidobacteriota bacterium]